MNSLVYGVCIYYIYRGVNYSSYIVYTHVYIYIHIQVHFVYIYITDLTIAHGGYVRNRHHSRGGGHLVVY